ncbi:MAG: hypothetical protein U0R44_03550 [Candidatus Micrarchaeia archaeon]
MTHRLTERQDQPKEGRAKAFKRYAPVVSIVAGTIMGLAPIMSVAQPRTTPRQCSASVQTGTMPSFTTTGAGGITLVSSPMMRENRYLSLQLPEPYMRSVREAAQARPEAERRAFIADAVYRNIENAYVRLGTSDRVSFDCLPLTDAAPRPSAVSDAGPAPTSTVTTSPRPSSSVPSDAGPAPAQPSPSDAGPVPDDSGRRRVIQF